ncbi:MAG: DMT family transporter [Candidatus Methanofastidiosia archaeon]
MLLVVVALYRSKNTHMKLGKRRLCEFFILGITGYAIAQGLQVFGLYYLPAVTVTFLLSFNPVFVLLLGIFFVGEHPSLSQIGGILITIVGIMFFFNNAALVFDSTRGIIITLLSGVGWASYMIISRYILRKKSEDVYLFTAFPMLMASAILLGTTAATGNIMLPSIKGWIIIVWLGAINTAAAFFLWNHSLQTLHAYEQSILQNTMLIQIALLAYIFLNEALTTWKIIGIILVFFGVLIVQLKPREEK